MTRGILLVALTMIWTACAAPTQSLDLEEPPMVEAPADPVVPVSAHEAPAVASAADVSDRLADQAVSDELAERPVEPGARAGRGSLVRPDWLGQRPLPLRPDGFGEVQPTPFELIDRRFPPASPLRAGGSEFESTIDSVPDDVLARSTWQPECPVSASDLAYVTVSYVGFDGVAYVGELLVDAAAAEAIVSVFEALYDARFPIEDMRIVSSAELDLAPTGDGNTTSAFVCRPVTAGSSWSQHAYGLAIDINPFHNPYVRGDLVLPELATVYTDRSIGFPGMILEGGPVVAAFDSIGWGWGGRWTSLTDPQHFSANGR